MNEKMSQRTCVVDWIKVGGDNPLTVISGPCSLEDPTINEKILLTLKEACDSLGLSFIFKASFDKANRTSINSNRGLGIVAGMQEFKRLKEKLYEFWKQKHQDKLEEADWEKKFKEFVGESVDH